MFLPFEADDWQRQVEDLARRAITLDALLRFYQGLGKETLRGPEASRCSFEWTWDRVESPFGAPRLGSMVLASVHTCKFHVGWCVF